MNEVSDGPADAPKRPRRGWFRTLLRFAGRAAWALFAAVVTLWTASAILFSNLPWAWLRAAAAGAFVVATVVAFARMPRRGRTTLWLLAAFAVVLVWWLQIPARQDGDWRAGVAVLPRVVFDGDRVTVTNVRDFEYRSKEDFTPRYAERTYDLAALDSLWLIVCYWDGNEAIAHTMLSFGFGPDEFLCVSVEARLEEREEYSAFAGAFKQLELTYVLGDERDLVGLRAKHRGERIYMYSMLLPRERMRSLFADILQGAERLALRPEFYSTLGRNCTTVLVDHMDSAFPTPVPFHRWMLMNGYSDELAYERRRIRTDRPFAEVRREHEVTEAARRLPADRDFARRLRAQLPKRR